MAKIILKICSMKKKNTNCWIQLNLELFLYIVSCCGSDINCKLSNNITWKQLNVIYYNSFSSKTLSQKKKNPKVKRSSAIIVVAMPHLLFQTSVLYGQWCDKKLFPEVNHVHVPMQNMCKSHQISLQTFNQNLHISWQILN